MGSSISRKKRKNQREVNEANANASFGGCYWKSCGSSTVDNDLARELTASELSFSFFNNCADGLATSSLDENSPDMICKPVFTVPRESNLSSQQTYLQPASHHRGTSRSSLSRPYSTTNSSGTYQSFEPTPLTQVLPQLYLGNQEDAEQAEKLSNLGITHIISIVGGGRYKDLCEKYMYIPLRDNGSSDLLEQLENSYDFMVESQEPNNKLFIHCQLGQNRSASFVIGFLMRWKKLSFHEAYTFLKEKRALIHPHKEYIKQLRDLDKQLHSVYSTPKNFLDIAFCSQDGIKILHHDFCRAASREYKKKQKVSMIEENDYSLSNSASFGEDQDPNVEISIKICFPGSRGGRSVSTNDKIDDKI